jgi:TetR/AcrR family transcriptional regulator, lmrAB and yxaGH operons repressor
MRGETSTDDPIQQFDGTSGPRERLVSTAIDLVRRRGVFATSVADLLKRSGSARNSIYQHFPDGKSELIASATTAAGEQMTSFIAHLTTTRTPTEAIDGLIKWWKRELVDSEFALGCPVVAAAMSAPDEPEVAATANVAFDKWRELLAQAAVADGLADAPAQDFGLFAINAIEGSIVQCRSQGDVRSLDVAAEHLKVLYRSLPLADRPSSATSS